MSALHKRLAAICETLPGATEARYEDGEIPSWKIGGKMFACMGHESPGVSVKCRDVETAQMLIDAGVAAKAPYFHRSWVRLPDEVAEDELRFRVTAAYDIVRNSLTKKVRSQWPEREDL